MDVNASFERVKSILNLWAPVAFAFEEPVALSNKLVSSVEVTKVSVIVSPTLYDGSFVYLSNTKLCLSTLTKKPFI